MCTVLPWAGVGCCRTGGADRETRPEAEDGVRRSRNGRRAQGAGRAGELRVALDVHRPPEAMTYAAAS